METIYGLATCMLVLSNGGLTSACYPPKLTYDTKQQCESVLTYNMEATAALNRNSGKKPGEEGYLWNECVRRTTPVWQR